MFPRTILLAITALALSSCIDKTKESADVKRAPPCPEVGHAISLCPDLQVKLLAARFHQAVGNETVVAADAGHVFCLVELEWPKLPEGQVRDIPKLEDGSGNSWPPHSAAETAWRAMQPGAKNPVVRPPVTAGDRETFIFSLEASVAAQGLYLRFAAPCDEAGESTHFCLGRHQIVME
jgi:hypothetical protein